MICTCIVCGEILLSHHVIAPTTDPERAIMFRDLCARIVGHINARHPEMASALLQLGYQHNCALVSKAATSTDEDFKTAQAMCIEAVSRTLTSPWEVTVHAPAETKRVPLSAEEEADYETRL